MAASPAVKEVLAFYNRWHADPSLFAKEVLGIDTWWQQDEIIRSVFTNLETAVKSCHASGKTKTAAICALGWLMYWPPGSALVITTSSSWPQVQREIWGEIRTCMGKSTWPWPRPNLTDVTMPGGSYAMGLSTNDAVNFHGYHAEHVLIIVDECSGVEEAIYLSLSGIKAGGDVHLLYLMNPTETSGWSVDIFDDPKVNCFTIDGLLTPNMSVAQRDFVPEYHADGTCSPDGQCPGRYHIYETEDLNSRDPDKAHNLLYLADTPIGACELDADSRPYLIRRRYIRDMYLDGIRKFGSLKPQADWFPRVRGLVPTELATQLVQKEWVDQAHLRRLTQRDALTVAGLDVAGPGKDETAICLRNGYQITHQQSWAQADPYDDITAVLGTPRPTLWVHVDAVAIGYNLATNLRRDGYQVVFVNASNKPFDNTRFVNYKAEAYWKLRELLQDGEIGGPIDPRCQRQLLTIRWDQRNAKRLIRIEPKEDAAKRGVPSPDWAEAMMLCFAGDPHGIRTGEMVYDSSTVLHGPTRTSNGNTELPTGPGWYGGAGWGEVTGQAEEVPGAMQRWLQSQAARKQAKREAVQAVLTQVEEPSERTRLYELLEIAD